MITVRDSRVTEMFRSVVDGRPGTFFTSYDEALQDGLERAEDMWATWPASVVGAHIVTVEKVYGVTR